MKFITETLKFDSARKFRNYLLAEGVELYGSSWLEEASYLTLDDLASEVGISYEVENNG